MRWRIGVRMARASGRVRPDHDGAGCMLGHRRLSIIDLSTAGDQPMTDGTGGRDRTIVFNGEIYNFKDLRRDLEQRRRDVRSRAATRR